MHLHERGYSVAAIVERLQEEHTIVSRVALYKLLKKYKERGSVGDRARRPRRAKLDHEHLVFIDNAMAQNDELSSRQLRQLLEEQWQGLRVSLQTVRRVRKNLGWVCTRPKYCQLVREINKMKRVEWCNAMLDANEKFQDVVWSDECTVQLDNHGRVCFRRKKQPRKLKPRPKHPVKVHIWGAISPRGASQLVIFSGIMTAIRYCLILEAALLPFLEDVFPGHRFQQDNDPKHCANYTREFLSEKNVNWWSTPPESPDLNPIENVWASLKHYLRHDYKPKDLDSLISGILKLWESLTPSTCQRYINHLHKVMPVVVAVNGAASGY